MTTKRLPLFCIILLLLTSEIFAKPFPCIILKGNNKFNGNLLNIKSFTPADTNYGRHRLLVDCIKSTIQTYNSWYESIIKKDYLLDKKIELMTGTKAPKPEDNSLNKYLIPTNPKQWNKKHLTTMAIHEIDFFPCLLVLYNAAIVTDKNGYFTDDATLARKALFNEFTPVSLSAQIKIDEIIYQNQNNIITKSDAVTKIVEIKGIELNNFMDVIKEVAIETKEKRQELKNLNKKKN
jgi:hypothetical protein